MTSLIARLASLLARRRAPKASTPTFEFVPTPIPARPTPVQTDYHLVELRNSLDRLDETDPTAVVGRARYWGGMYYAPKGKLDAARRAMRAEPAAAWIFCDDANGYVREAALRALDEPPSSPGRLMMLAMRLNDWVPEVRRAAVEAAERLLPDTPVEVLVACAGIILRRRFEWTRWSDEAGALDSAYCRPEVVEAIAQLLRGNSERSPGRLMRDMLRLPAIDPFLPDLAVKAKSASVRAVALRALINQQAVWPIGFRWTWVDKVFNQRRREIVLGVRQLSGVEPEGLIRRAAQDRSSAVRKIAADALWFRTDSMSDVREIAGRLSGDRNAGVRERAGFVLKKLSGAEA